VDIDILNSAEELKGLLDALNPGGDFGEILKIRAEISDEVEERPENVFLKEVQGGAN
jgi:hypothetical protein